MRRHGTWAKTIVGVLIALVAALGAVALGPTDRPVGADPGSVGAGSGGGTVSVGAGSGSGSPGSPGGTGGASGSGGGSGGSGSSPWVCTYTYLALNNEGGFPPGGPTPGGWYSVTCDDLATGAQVTQTVWITGAAPPSVPQVDPRTVALQAERSMHLPAPAIHLDPSGTAVVGLPTWLWIDPSLWGTDAVTASAGDVSATAVARPVGVTWVLGDGSTIACGGPGTPYDPARPATAQETYCSHVYAQSSLGQASPDGDPDDGSYAVTATVEWAVSWDAVGAAGGGVLPTLYTTSATRLRVVQVQSLDIAAGPLADAGRTTLAGGS